MTEDHIPDDVRRFITLSIPSVPHLEAILLCRHDSHRAWTAKEVAERLYMSEKTAGDLLSDLCGAGMLTLDAASTLYRYTPHSDELRSIVDRLAQVYAKNLVSVTNLIHSKTGKKAQQFADAFKLRKD